MNAYHLARIIRSTCSRVDNKDIPQRSLAPYSRRENLATQPCGLQHTQTSTRPSILHQRTLWPADEIF